MTVLPSLRTAAATTALLLLAGCGGEVTIGEATTSVSPASDAPTATGPVADPAAPETAVAVTAVGPALNPEPTVVGTAGVLQLHLPQGWVAIEGSDMAAAGDTSPLQGGNQVTSVPAGGRSADDWAQALVAGQTDLFADEEGMELQTPVTTMSGLTLFHLVQSYSGNKAQVFGTVVDDTLHLVRFGLDGSADAAEVAKGSAATLSLVS